MTARRRWLCPCSNLRTGWSSPHSRGPIPEAEEVGLPPCVEAGPVDPAGNQAHGEAVVQEVVGEEKAVTVDRGGADQGEHGPGAGALQEPLAQRDLWRERVRPDSYAPADQGRQPARSDR